MIELADTDIVQLNINGRTYALQDLSLEYEGKVLLPYQDNDFDSLDLSELTIVYPNGKYKLTMDDIDGDLYTLLEEMVCPT